MPEVLIRAMGVEDSVRVAELAKQLGYSVFSAEVRVRLERVDGDESVSLLVAVVDGRIVGWIQVNRESPTLLSKPRAEISALVVDEQSRGQGIGAKLLAAAEAWARANELDLVRLRSNVKREDAHRFYLRQGYTIEKSWHLFTKSLKS